MASTAVHESTDELKIYLARRIFAAVVLNSSSLKIKDVLKIQDIKRIVGLLKKRSQWNGVRTFLQLYPCFFLVVDEGGTLVIKPLVTVEFCRDFDRKKGCPKSFCSKLHVCRHFVKGKCTFGARCKKPHHFQDNETREILKKHLLDGLDDDQTREFLCRNVQHLLDPEISVTELPKSLEICKYYNVATGCTRDFCPYIHICRFFAEEGNCKFGSQCIRKHEINNVHSSILLHRYNMDHLNDHQVLSYLKIKSESREQQQQQQQQQLQQKLIQTDQRKQHEKQPHLHHRHMQLPPVTQPQNQLGSGDETADTIKNIPSNISNHFLPSKQLIFNGQMKRLSPPEPLTNGSAMDMIHKRKLSLPTHLPAHQRATIAESLRLVHSHESAIKDPMGLPHRSDEKINTPRNSFDNSVHTIHSNSGINSTSQSIIHQRISKSFNEAHADMLSTSFTKTLNLTEVAKQSGHCSSNSIITEGLGLDKLSTSTCAENNTSELTVNILCKQVKSQTNIPKSKSFEHFERQKWRDDNRSFESEPPLSSCLFRNSPIHTPASSLFCNSLSFISGSSNEIINHNDSPPQFNDFVNDKLQLTGNLTWIENDSSSKVFTSKNDEHYPLTYCRTQSLPDFYLQNQRNLNPKTNSDIIKLTKSNCSCKKNEICEYYLKNACRDTSCGKYHTDEPFQWQILPKSETKYMNGYKNENMNSLNNRRWTNVEKNENIKIELGYCSVEIDQVEIDYFGENMTIDFDDMVAVSKGDMQCNGQRKSSMSCDLSKWLLQIKDESSTGKNSQDTLTYKVRRLGTSSSCHDDVDHPFSTTWRWYWQDSFGMWRSYPVSKSEVIDSTTTCLSHEIEADYSEYELEGRKQNIFEKQQLLIDFKAMVEIKAQSRKQKKIRRRPKFSSKEHKDQADGSSQQGWWINNGEIPWYWNQQQVSDFSSYQLVDLEDNSTILTNVHNHFNRSMSGLGYEILKVKSVQNLHLWAKFIRFRCKLKSADVKVAEKFVFKCVSLENSLGVCQQGFRICTCKPSDARTINNDNYFGIEASKALEFDSIDYSANKDVKYMFCIRMSVPLNEWKESCFSMMHEYRSSAVTYSNGFVNPQHDYQHDYMIYCSHGNQVYPEFLIVFKKI